MIPTDIDDPLEVFDATDVSKNVMRFVVYILWLKPQPNSFEEYPCVRELHFDLWRDCVYKLWRLCKERRGVALVMRKHTSRKTQGSQKVENKTLFNVRIYVGIS